MKEIDELYKIIKYAIDNNQEKMVSSIKNFAKVLKKNGKNDEANLFFDLIGSNKDQVSAASYSYFDNSKLKILEEYENNIELNNYVDPMSDVESTNNFIHILKNKSNRMNKIIKILIYGRPGTGKTTYLKYIAKMANMNVYIIKASKLISSFIGDTQKNIDLLFEDIKYVYKNSIILIDELDSVLGDRQNVINDEYKRMVGSFCMMLDSLLEGSIFFAITNRINLIDEAVLRRFNVKIELNDVSNENFITALFEKANFENIELDIKLISKILKLISIESKNIQEKLTFSMIDELLINYQFFRKNMYYSLFNKLIDNSSFNENDYKKFGFNYLEISKILEMDQRTVKKNLIESIGK